MFVVLKTEEDFIHFPTAFYIKLDPVVADIVVDHSTPK
jgi:hypothetical protein